MGNRSLIQRTVVIAALTAVAMMFSYIEVLLPVTAFVPVAGFKLGLANIVTMIALHTVRLRDTLCIVLIRCLLTALLFTGVTGLLFSMSGSLLALAVMAPLVRQQRLFSTVGVSVAGAAAHNLGQLCAAAVLLGSPGIAALTPFLMGCAFVTGILVGLAAALTLSGLRKAGMTDKGFTLSLK